MTPRDRDRDDLAERAKERLRYIGGEREIERQRQTGKKSK